MKLLGVLEIGGTEWKVYLATPKEQPELEGATYGLTDYDNAKIYISKHVGASRRREVVWHEAMHAAIEVSGAGHAIHKAIEGGKTDDNALHELDERLVSMLSPVTLTLAQQILRRKWT